MAVNADEGEPGTFKDRFYLERSPHRFLEGVLIAAWAVEAEAVYIYLRDEYPAVREILIEEIERIRVAGLTAHTQVSLRPRCRCLHLWRGVLDDRIHRGQARVTAPIAPLT